MGRRQFVIGRSRRGTDMQAAIGIGENPCNRALFWPNGFSQGIGETVFDVLKVRRVAVYCAFLVKLFFVPENLVFLVSSEETLTFLSDSKLIAHGHQSGDGTPD